MRFDLQIIASWIEPGARVLDLGCGEGDLLHYLKIHKQVTGTGIEQVEARSPAASSRGFRSSRATSTPEVLDFPDQAFRRGGAEPDPSAGLRARRLIRSLLRIGRRGIVSFPNFSHWRIRAATLLSGYAPIPAQLPYEWYDTPNIRVITLKDFRRFSREVGFRILREKAVSTGKPRVARGSIVRYFRPTLRATYRGLSHRADPLDPRPAGTASQSKSTWVTISFSRTTMSLLRALLARAPGPLPPG